MKTSFLITVLLLLGIIYMSISENKLHATSVKTEKSTIYNTQDSILIDSNYCKAEISKPGVIKEQQDPGKIYPSGKHMTNIFIIL